MSSRAPVWFISTIGVNKGWSSGVQLRGTSISINPQSMPMKFFLRANFAKKFKTIFAINMQNIIGFLSLVKGVLLAINAQNIGFYGKHCHQYAKYFTCKI
ncbi:hypothetical protein AMTRI_Chr10g230110 [Amborella trichopoda]